MRRCSEDRLVRYRQKWAEGEDPVVGLVRIRGSGPRLSPEDIASFGRAPHLFPGFIESLIPGVHDAINDPHTGGRVRGASEVAGAFAIVGAAQEAAVRLADEVDGASGSGRKLLGQESREEACVLPRANEPLGIGEEVDCAFELVRAGLCESVNPLALGAHFVSGHCLLHVEPTAVGAVFPDRLHDEADIEVG